MRALAGYARLQVGRRQVERAAAEYPLKCSQGLRFPDSRRN